MTEGKTFPQTLFRRHCSWWLLWLRQQKTQNRQNRCRWKRILIKNCSIIEFQSVAATAVTVEPPTNSATFFVVWNFYYLHMEIPFYTFTFTMEKWAMCFNSNSDNVFKYVQRLSMYNVNAVQWERWKWNRKKIECRSSYITKQKEIWM